MAIVKMPKAVKATAAEAEKKVEAVAEKAQKTEKKAAAKAAYVAEGHRASSIKKLAVYIKPEERKAYYVINEKDTGSIDF